MTTEEMQITRRSKGLPWKIGLILVLLTCAMNPATAGVTVYTNQTQFENATGATTVRIPDIGTLGAGSKLRCSRSSRFWWRLSFSRYCVWEDVFGLNAANKVSVTAPRRCACTNPASLYPRRIPIRIQAADELFCSVLNLR